MACGAHALHDGYTDLIYVMLPVWQYEFGLGFAMLGVLKTLFSGALASFQIPSGVLAERFGAPLVLALGTALTGVGYGLAGFSPNIGAVALFVAGLGASTQHPLASSLIASTALAVIAVVVVLTLPLTLVLRPVLSISSN